MPELPRLSAKEAERLLLQEGFAIDRQKGSHRIYKNTFIEWSYPITQGRLSTQKSSKSFLPLSSKQNKLKVFDRRCDMERQDSSVVGL